MATQEVKRKLAAILSADVKGYSRLMGEDEEWTVHTLNTYKDMMKALIQQHRGRVVDAPGDNVLAEFASVVDAVQSAVEIQQVLRAKNAMLPENRRMEFRIGINLGDVIEEKDTIYGDGVNIAARLEGLAEAGGICISGSAYEQIENKLPLRYDYLGEHEVKNIAKPVRVYRARIEAESVSPKLGEEKKSGQKRLSKVALGIIAVVVIAGAVILYQFVLRPSPSKTEVASKEKMAFPLPDEPSIAVMPLVNMSDDPKQEFLCDGMTEGIITALSKVPRLFVIARTSTFAYKGRPVKVKQVSEELGVQYVLEGSIQRSADRIRINLQLIDALTSRHIWAQKYDRDLKDIFALQDEITIRILTAVRVKLTGMEPISSVPPKKLPNLDCYLKLMEADGYRPRWNIENSNLARRMVEEAIAMCPESPMGYIQLGWVYFYDYMQGYTKAPRETLEKGIELTQKALAINDSIGNGHALLCAFYRMKGDLVKAITEGERAVALDPSSPGALNNYAHCLTASGRPEEAIPIYQKAIRLSPLGFHYLFEGFGYALRMTGRHEEAVSAFKKTIQLAPDNFRYHAELAITYAMMGREEEARAEGKEVLRIDPKFTIERYVKHIPADQSYKDRIAEALLKAGLK